MATAAKASEPERGAVLASLAVAHELAALRLMLEHYLDKQEGSRDR
jgi:hypothetical protein